MFNFINRNSDTKKYKGNTIYINKPVDIDIELYLDIIVRNIELYVNQNKIMPQKIKIDYENYNRILNYNKTLIEKKGNKYYTFGVEIEV